MISLKCSFFELVSAYEAGEGAFWGMAESANRVKTWGIKHTVEFMKRLRTFKAYL